MKPTKTLLLAASIACLTACGGSGASNDPMTMPKGGVTSDLGPGGFAITQALTLSVSPIVLGDTVTATVVYTNQSNAPVVVQAATIAARPPGGSHANGPYDDFTPQAPAATVQPGQSMTVSATRTFAAGDPVGTWDLYATYKDASGQWYDGDDLDVAVTDGTATDGGSNTGPSDGGTVVGTGAFSVANGKIIDPNGKTFVARGVNFGDDNLPTITANDAGKLLTSLFPGINFVRLAVGSYEDPSYYKPLIDQVAPYGIVVEIEDHTTYAGMSPPYTGSQLQAELAWYQGIATAFKDNPYVWFGTLNEPGTSDNMYGASEAAISAQQQSIYQTIRGTGNDAVLMCEAGLGGGNPGSIGAGFGFDVADYASMKNIVWDIHYYGWVANYSTDQTLVTADLIGSASSGEGILACQSIPSADGLVPVIIGEYGETLDGVNIFANHDQVVYAATTSGYGCVAWHWNELTSNNSSLTPFGQQVAAAIAKIAAANP